MASAFPIPNTPPFAIRLDDGESQPGNWLYAKKETCRISKMSYQRKRGADGELEYNFAVNGRCHLRCRSGTAIHINETAARKVIDFLNKWLDVRNEQRQVSSQQEPAENI